VTPTALHALVAGPYKMSDGSTRRGIWERVPETKPGGLLIESETIEGGWNISFESVDRYSSAEGLWADTEQGNAALIRVAIEDWLGYVTIERGTDDDPCSVLANLGGGRGSFDFEGPTVLHALVCAAHAVADALNVPA
jgi:hypothetical protein